MRKESAHPQEIIVWYIIPFLRREIALAMKSKGIDQKSIASSLAITEAAVSQYLNDKRARKMKISSYLKDEIYSSAENIIKNKKHCMFEIQRLIGLNEVRSIVCDIHKKEFGADKDCSICPVEI